MGKIIAAILVVAYLISRKSKTVSKVAPVTTSFPAPIYGSSFSSVNSGARTTAVFPKIKPPVKPPKPVTKKPKLITYNERNSAIPPYQSKSIVSALPPTWNWGLDRLIGNNSPLNANVEPSSGVRYYYT